MVQITEVCCVSVAVPIVLSFIFLGALVSIVLKKLTVAGACFGVCVAVVIYWGGGLVSLLSMAAFFVLATAATFFKKSAKEKMQAAEENGGRRNGAQVLANAGAACLCALLAWFFPADKLLFVMALAACFSAATADTLSSELGSVYGRQFYNIVSFKPDKRGKNGVVSLQGTLAGILGSCIIALPFSIVFGWQYFIWVVLAGTLGNIADSILGATLERSGAVNNNWVNFLNTVCAALAMVVFFLWL